MMTTISQDSKNLEFAILQERLRQARHSFNMALFVTTACGITGLIGIGLVVTGKTSEGSVLTTGGMAPIAVCLQFAKDANARLDDIFQELQNDRNLPS